MNHERFYLKYGLKLVTNLRNKVVPDSVEAVLVSMEAALEAILTIFSIKYSKNLTVAAVVVEEVVLVHLPTCLEIK